MKLTSSDWDSLTRSVSRLAEGKAYGYNQVWNAVYETCTQVLNIVEYETPDNLVITKQATTHARIAQHPRQQQQCIRLDKEQEDAAGQTSKAKLPDILVGEGTLLVATGLAEGQGTKTALLCCLGASQPRMLHRMLATMQPKERRPALQGAKHHKGMQTCVQLSRQRV